MSNNGHRISNQVLLETQKWRYAVKKFDATKTITNSDWETLEDALILSPSSYGLQPWKFLVIQSPEIRKKLTPASWNQTQVEDCSHYVVFLVRDKVDEKYIDHFVEELAKTRGITTDKMASYRSMMLGDLVKGPRSAMIREWASRQAYIALGNLMTSAALLGIDSCPMEGFIPEKYDEILDLKNSGYSSLVCLALGYRSANDSYAQLQKVRFAKKELIQYL